MWVHVFFLVFALHLLFPFHILFFRHRDATLCVGNFCSTNSRTDTRFFLHFLCTIYWVFVENYTNIRIENYWRIMYLRVKSFNFHSPFIYSSVRGLFSIFFLFSFYFLFLILYIAAHHRQISWASSILALSAHTPHSLAFSQQRWILSDISLDGGIYSHSTRFACKRNLVGSLVSCERTSELLTVETTTTATTKPKKKKTKNEENIENKENEENKEKEKKVKEIIRATLSSPKINDMPDFR